MGVVTGLTGLSAVGMLVALVLVGTAGLREVTSGVGPLVFSTPVRPTSYLVGKLAGATGAVVIAEVCGALAMAVTLALRADSAGGTGPALAPFEWQPWAFGALLFVLPNLLFISTFVFLAALLTRRMGTTFLAILPVILGQDLAEALGASHPTSVLPSLMDPMGLAALQGATRHWSVAQFEQALPALSGPLLANRLLWLAVTVLLGCGARYALHARARLVAGGRRRRPHQGRAHHTAAVPLPSADASPLTQARPAASGRARAFAQARAVARFEFRRWSRGLVFLTLLFAGFAVATYSLVDGERVLGVAGLPGSRAIMLAMERATRLTLTLLVVLLTGELVWRERVSGIAATLDAYPASRTVVALGKVAALAAVVTIMVTAFGVFAWALQASLSGAAAPFGHVLALIGHSALGAFQLAAVALLLQILAGGPTLGYLVVGVALALRIALRAMGHTGGLYSLQGLRLPDFGRLEGIGRGAERALLTHAYWTALALLVVGFVVCWWPRGVAATLAERCHQARARVSLVGAWVLLGLATTTALFGTGLYRSTEAPGAGWTSPQFRAARALYETTYGHLRDAPVPSVDAIRGDVDLDTSGARMEISGSYRLIHRGAEPLSELLISYEPDLTLLSLEHFAAAPGRAPHGVSGSPGEAPGTHWVTFDPPLLPGQATYLAFALRFDAGGWGRRPILRWLRKNGTFLLGGTGTHEFFQGAQVFPKLGYDAARELRSTRHRERYGLAPWTPGVTPEEYARSRDAAHSSNEWASVDLWVHTAADEVALAPGELVEDSVSSGRRHQHFVSNEPIPAMFPIICGRYELARGEHGDVALEVHHAPGHGARVPHMLWAIEQSLSYFEQRWGPFPHKTLRVAEVPGGATFACSFPGVMAFAEGMAFTQPLGDGVPLPIGGDDAAYAVDPILWLVAHEVAHQWWNGQVVAAPALGAELVSESLAQYGAVCVIEEVYGTDVAAATAKEHRERYLRGRSRADRDERTLVHVDEQDHLHYGKGFLAFHALAHQFGREPLDRALALLLKEHGGPGGVPLLSTELLAAIEEELPTEAATKVDALFRRIGFQDASLEAATYHERSDGTYQLVVEGAVRGVEAGPRGDEVEAPFEGEVQLGVTLGEADRQITRQVAVTDGRFRLEARFSSLPTHIALDPHLLLIDRDLSDNESTPIEAKP